MPTSFYTLYGSNLHGVKVNWQNDPSKSGDRTLTMAITLNLYSAKFTAGLENDVTTGGVTYSKEPQYTTLGWDTSTNTFAKSFNLLFSWKNPVASGVPAYDGFDARFDASVGADFTKPALTIKWADPATPYVYDTKPASVNQKPTVKDVTDAGNAALAFDNIAPLASELNTNLCKEIWKFSDTAQGCVLLKGTLTRLFKTTDPYNLATAAAGTKQDLDLDYVIYSTNVAFGDLNEAKLFYTFTAENVNYDTFNQVTLGAVQTVTSLSLSAAALVAAAMLW